MRTRENGHFLGRCCKALAWRRRRGRKRLEDVWDEQSEDSEPEVAKADSSPRRRARRFALSIEAEDPRQLKALCKTPSNSTAPSIQAEDPYQLEAMWKSASTSFALSVEAEDPHRLEETWKSPSASFAPSFEAKNPRHFDAWCKSPSASTRGTSGVGSHSDDAEYTRDLDVLCKSPSTSTTGRFRAGSQGDDEEEFFDVGDDDGDIQTGKKETANPGIAFNGTWTCTETWGLDDFLKATGVSMVHRMAAKRAPWPEWSFQWASGHMTFVNRGAMGDLREEFAVDGSEFRAVDGWKQTLTCRAQWADATLVIDRNTPQGDFHEERWIDSEGRMHFRLSAAARVGGKTVSWGRVFASKAR